MRIGFDGKRAVQNFTGLGNYSRYIADIGRDMEKLDDITLCTFADSDYLISILACFTKFIRIYFPVNEMIVLWVSHEYILYAPKKRNNKRLGMLTEKYPQLHLASPATSFSKRIGVGVPNTSFDIIPFMPSS